MRPTNPVHPGRMLLKESLRLAGISQRAFAVRLGRTNTRLNGRRGMTDDSTLDPAAALGTRPKLRPNLRMYFDLARAESRRRAS